MTGCFPNLFIIGAPKCGTTSLANYLATHPNIIISSPKEPGFFLPDLHLRQVTDERVYKSLFKRRNKKNVLWYGEATASYLFFAESLEAIKKNIKNFKSICLIRNPAELVVSLHAECLKEGVENVRSFEEAWKLQAARRQGKCLPPGCSDPRWILYSEWGKLGTQLERARRILSEDSLLILFLDDLRKHPRQVYLHALNFLGLPDDGRAQFPRLNERREPRWPWVPQIWSQLVARIQPVRKHLTGGRGFGLGKIVMRTLYRPIASNRLDAIPDWLYDYYREEVLKLEKMTNRPLIKEWRYG